MNGPAFSRAWLAQPNKLLLGSVLRGVEALGLEVHINTRVPANDGGISLGQAFLLRERLR